MEKTETGLIVRNMIRGELDTAVEWAAAEGWNPGLHDAEIFWRTDPRGFLAAEMEGRMIGSGSIVSYAGRFGFLGFFMLLPEYRHGGLGRVFGLELKARLAARLEPPFLIGLDGVFAMQDFYARAGGFRFFCRNIRQKGLGEAAKTPGFIVDLSSVPFVDVLAYDARHFPGQRPGFLSQWVAPKDGLALGAIRDGRLCGYGVVRRCRVGHKIGPLFADDPQMAEGLYAGLSDRAVGEPLFLDTPENNPDALALAQRHGMHETFGCARMYIGGPPSLPHHEIFGVTTFELG